MGLLSNRVSRGSLKPGDHIYSWRTAYIYAHHGIYIGDGKVVHFTRRGQEVGTGTVLDILLISSGPARSREPCQTCTQPHAVHGVVCSCLNCFLAGGVLTRRLATGMLQVVPPQIPVTLASQPPLLVSR